MHVGGSSNRAFEPSIRASVKLRPSRRLVRPQFVNRLNRMRSLTRWPSMSPLSSMASAPMVACRAGVPHCRAASRAGWPSGGCQSRRLKLTLNRHYTHSQATCGTFPNGRCSSFRTPCPCGKARSTFGRAVCGCQDAALPLTGLQAVRDSLSAKVSTLGSAPDLLTTLAYHSRFRPSRLTPLKILNPPLGT